MHILLGNMPYIVLLIVGVPNRDAIFNDRAMNFTDHANKLANTAVAVASGGGCNNKRIIEGINHAAQDVSCLR